MNFLNIHKKTKLSCCFSLTVNELLLAYCSVFVEWTFWCDFIVVNRSTTMKLYLRNMYCLILVSSFSGLPIPYYRLPTVHDISKNSFFQISEQNVKLIKSSIEWNDWLPPLLNENWNLTVSRCTNVFNSNLFLLLILRRPSFTSNVCAYAFNCNWFSFQVSCSLKWELSHHSPIKYINHQPKQMIIKVTHRKIPCFIEWFVVVSLSSNMPLLHIIANHTHTCAP